MEKEGQKNKEKEGEGRKKEGKRRVEVMIVENMTTLTPIHTHRAHQT